MSNYFIHPIQITSITAVKQASDPTPLRLSLQNNETKPPLLPPSLDQQAQFNLNTKNKYQRLPIRTIYEEISVLDSFEDNECSDFPVLFKVKKDIPKFPIPVKDSLFELKGKSNLLLNSKRTNKGFSKNKRNSNPGNSKAMYIKDIKANDKNSFCFLNAERLKGLLDYNPNRKKLVQGDFIGNGTKKEILSKRNLKATDVLVSYDENRTNPKSAPSNMYVKEGINSCYFDLVDKITLKSILSSKKRLKKRKKTKSGDHLNDNLLAVFNRYMTK